MAVKELVWTLAGTIAYDDNTFDSSAAIVDGGALRYVGPTGDITADDATYGLEFFQKLVGYSDNLDLLLNDLVQAVPGTRPSTAGIISATWRLSAIDAQTSNEVYCFGSSEELAASSPYGVFDAANVAVILSDLVGNTEFITFLGNIARM